eukprot:Amastigsp_a844115_116.p2 type:complete len:174 gc:universal Amastigsp_a844115_116:426-947(+)
MRLPFSSSTSRGRAPRTVARTFARPAGVDCVCWALERSSICAISNFSATVWTRRRRRRSMRSRSKCGSGSRTDARSSSVKRSRRPSRGWSREQRKRRRKQKPSQHGATRLRRSSSFCPSSATRSTPSLFSDLRLLSPFWATKALSPRWLWPHSPSLRSSSRCLWLLVALISMS